MKATFPWSLNASAAADEEGEVGEGGRIRGALLEEEGARDEGDGGIVGHGMLHAQSREHKDDELDVTNTLDDEYEELMMPQVGGVVGRMIQIGLIRIPRAAE